MQESEELVHDQMTRLHRYYVTMSADYAYCFGMLGSVAQSLGDATGIEPMIGVASEPRHEVQDALAAVIKQTSCADDLPYQQAMDILIYRHWQLWQYADGEYDIMDLQDRSVLPDDYDYVDILSDIIAADLLATAAEEADQEEAAAAVRRQDEEAARMLTLKKAMASLVAPSTPFDEYQAARFYVMDWLEEEKVAKVA